MNTHGNWITTSLDTGDVCPVFRKTWHIDHPIRLAELHLTALGIYEATLNGQPVSNYVLAPGWTVYDKRLQVQCYDVTGLLCKENTLEVTVGRGWFRSPLPGFLESEDKTRRYNQPCGILGWLQVEYADGTEEMILTDESWQWGESPVRFSEIYDGEVHDANFKTSLWHGVVPLDWSKEILIHQEGEKITEQERIAAVSVITTPAGETVVDFGQVVTGYPEFTVNAHAGDRIHILHGEVLDKDGNFYNANYRSAKSEIHYICTQGRQTWHPKLTFFGFRYIKLVAFPGEIKAEQFTAIAVNSEMKRTGYLRCSDKDLTQLFSNIFWGQKGNFLDVPTDCPQRDERLGWTGDAQVFVKTASYQFDVEKFFRKWLRDLSAHQRSNGGVGQIIPDVMPQKPPSAAWGDAATIVPWQIYLTYGNIDVLADQFDSMCRWVDYIGSVTTKVHLWIGGKHFGDWLALDSTPNNRRGASRQDFIASAFYAYSTELVIKAGHILGKDVAHYETLYERILAAFRDEFPTYVTQTEHVLAVQFRLAKDLQATADALADMVIRDGKQLRTGFVGTPYLLHVLSNYGHSELAYDLLLRKAYPGWLYSVGKGATTIWEHWDGIMEDGSFWSDSMNSYNHYAYGAVADWVYEKAAGIQLPEDAPGFSRVRIAPNPDKRIDWLEASIDTRHGMISSKWSWTGDAIRYEITTAVPAEIVIDDTVHTVTPGSYTFWENR